jgi:hypothetical protein
MLLPSGHAGTVVELLPNQRLGNAGQDLLFSGRRGEREVLFDYRLLPLETSPQTLSHTVRSVLMTRQNARRRLWRSWTSHEQIGPNTAWWDDQK